MKIAICDDKENDRNSLMKLIKKSFDSENIDDEPEISLFECGEDLEYHYSNRNSPFDIIFLDILMSGKNGIKTAHEIRKYDNECIIIFTTVSTEYALEGYSVYAYNYIVKPLTIDNFKTVFLKAKEVIDSKEQKSLCIKTGAKIQAIHYRNIKYITSQGKKIFVFANQNEIIEGFYKLDDIESMIADPRFIRSHKSYLVNMDCIKSVEKYHFVLDDNTLIPIRQKDFAKIRQKYYDYIIKKAG